MTVSPDEIPGLERRLSENPGDADANIRYAAALFAGGDCERATIQANRVMGARPQSAVPTLILGQCSEQDGDYAGAREFYAAYLDGYGSEAGADAVRARDGLAAREEARVEALRVLQAEATMPDPDPEAMAVLPWDVASGEDVQALSLGLSTLVTTDLLLLQRFRLLERIRLAAVLDELDMGQTEAVAAATAPRVGRLVGAGQLLQGTMLGGPGAPATLSATVTRFSGEVTRSSTRSAPFEDLLVLEKELVLEISRDLGYVLSAAERNAIMESGTQNMTAFLSYSQGLVAEELGDYETALAHYGNAVRADPGFQEARTRLRTTAATGATEGSTPAQITTVEADAGDAATVEESAATGSNTVDSALTNSIVDVAMTQGETVGEGSGSSDATKQINKLTQPVTKADILRATIRIRIPIPSGE